MSFFLESPDGHVHEISSRIDAVNLLARGYRQVNKPARTSRAADKSTEKKEK